MSTARVHPRTLLAISLLRSYAQMQEFDMFADTSTPVVLLGCFLHSGLGIIRSLGRMGVPVYVIDTGQFAIGFASKYCREKFIWDVEKAPPDESVSFLAGVGRKLGCRAVLIPNSDAQALFVADYADRLVDHFIFPNPGAALVHSL